MKTAITEMLGIEYPIVQGGMMNVGFAGLASAVSNAGGLGMLTALAFPTPEALREEIERTRSMTSKPFAVNLTVFPTINSPDYGAYCKAIIEGGVKVVETAGNAAIREIWPIFKQAGVTVIHKSTSVRHSMSAEKYGVDIISADGFECAGHPGEDDIPGLVLIPATKDKLSIPIIASGGIADGRGLVAALSLGADAVNMGTRFLATKEAMVHDNIKQLLVDNSELGTNLIFRTLKNTARVAKTDLSDEVVRRLSEPGATFDVVAELVAGVKSKEALKSGDVEKGMIWASIAQGLINDVPSVQELLDRMVGEAKSIISQKLAPLCD